MAESRVKLVIDSQEFDAKLKRAGDALNSFFDVAKKGDRTFEVVDEGVMEAVQAMGRMETASKSAKGSLAELQKAFTDMSLTYRRFTDEEKASPVGKAMAQSLTELKARINDTKEDLAAINQELSGSKFGKFGGVIDTVGHKMGLTANVTELLTSKTALMAAGIGAAATGAAMAAKKWAEYNQELAKQDQQTNIITGLDGFAANKMTDTMRALSDTYKVDFRAAVEAANTLMSQFGKSGDEAISLIKDGMQGMMMGEGGKMLQMIQQYAPAFRDAGVSASQLIAVIHNTQGGLFSPENMSAIVMGMKNIRLMTKQTSDALAKLGIDGKKMSQDLNDGTITVFDALKQVAGELKNVDSNSQAAGQVMQAVFGRQGAMAGTNLAKAIEELNTNLDETKKKTGELGDAFAELQTANEKLNTAIRDAFSYDGWEQMATGIKATLISALADVVNILDGIGVTWDNLMKKMGLRQDYKNIGAGIGGALLNALPNTIKEPAQQISELRTSTNRQVTYNRQVSQYDARIAEQQKKVEQLTATPSDPALKAATEAYSAAHPEWQSVVNDEKKTLADLQQMRAAYMKQGQEVLKEKPKQEPTPLLTSDTGGKKTPAQQAQAKFDQAEKDYQQALEAAALAVKSGQADTVAAKKKELAAAESLWKAIGDAREVYDSDAFKTAQEDAAKKVVELGGSVNALVEEQKKAQEAARKLAAAQEKAATAYQQMQVAQANNDFKAYNAAQKQYQTAQADVQRLQASLPELPNPQGEKVVYTVEVNDVQLEKLKALPTDDKTIKVNVEEGEVNLPLLPKDDQTIRFNVEQGKVDLPDIPKDDQTIRFNVEQGNVDLPQMPEKTYTVTIEAATEAAAVKVDELVAGMNAEKVTIPVEVEQPNPVQLPVKMSYTEGNMSAFLATLKEKIAQEDLGSTLYNNLTAQLADANALANLMQTAIKNGIDVSQFNPQDLWKKVFSENPGDYISDKTWQSIQDAINAKLKEMKLDPIKLNFETGGISSEKTRRNNNSEELKLMNQQFSTITHDLSSISSSLNTLGLDVPEGVNKVLNGMQAISTILTAIQSLISISNTTSGLNSIPIIGGVASLFVGLFSSFDKGGIVPHAANGYFVPGTHRSGDVTPIMANAGELVLNTSSQNSLAADILHAQSLVSAINDMYLSEGQAIGSWQSMKLANALSYTQKNRDVNVSISSDQIKLTLRNGAQARGMTLGQYLEI